MCLLKNQNQSNKNKLSFENCNNRANVAKSVWLTPLSNDVMSLELINFGKKICAVSALLSYVSKEAECGRKFFLRTQSSMCIPFPIILVQGVRHFLNTMIRWRCGSRRSKNTMATFFTNLMNEIILLYLPHTKRNVLKSKHKLSKNTPKNNTRRTPKAQENIIYII